MLKYFLGRYKTQEMCNKVVGDFLPTLKFIPDWFVTNKMIKTLLMLYSQMMIDILSFDEDSGNVTFLSDKRVVV